MKKIDWYESWFSSSYYKLLYAERNEQEAEDFINALLAYLQPKKGSKMLDIACGEGRFSIQLEERGFDVTGIDLSDASISKAKKHENEHLHFHVHDMRYPFYINHFDYSFNFFTSFGYFGNDADNIMAARSFAKGLKKGGTLVIDYLNPQYIIDNLVSEEIVNKNGHTFDIKRKVESGFIIKEITINDAHGETHHFDERVSAFELADFIRIFDAAEMRLTDTFGNYTLDDYDHKTSPRQIMIFKK